MLKKQVTEIHAVADMFLWEQSPNIPVDRNLCAEADGVVFVDPKERRPKEDLVSLGLWN